MAPADAGYGAFTECSHMHCSLCHVQGVVLHSEDYEEKKKQALCFSVPFLSPASWFSFSCRNGI